METVKSAIFPFIVFYNNSSVSQKDLKIKRENPIIQKGKFLVRFRIVFPQKGGARHDPGNT